MMIENDAYIAACGLIDGTHAKDDRAEAIEACLRSEVSDVRRVGRRAWLDDEIVRAQSNAERLRGEASGASEPRASQILAASRACDGLVDALLLARESVER